MMPAWLDGLAVAVVVGAAGAYLLVRATRRVLALHPLLGQRHAAAACACGSDCATSVRGRTDATRNSAALTQVRAGRHTPD
jgi:hypothetical protein